VTVAPGTAAPDDSAIMPVREGIVRSVSHFSFSVDEAAKHLEDSRKTMDLIENHEPTFVLHQIQFRISQLCAA
jgi:hypothetical protein